MWQYRYDAFGRRVEKRCLNPQSLKSHGQGAGHGRHRRTKDRVLGASHRTRSLWQGSQIVEQWRSFRGEDPGEGATSETVQIDRWHYELGGQSFKPLAKESLLPQSRGDIEVREQEPQQEPIKSHLYAVVSDPAGTPKELYNLKGECVWQAQHELWGRAHIRKAKGHSEHKALTTTTPHSYAWRRRLRAAGHRLRAAVCGAMGRRRKRLALQLPSVLRSAQRAVPEPGPDRTGRWVADPGLCG